MHCGFALGLCDFFCRMMLPICPSLTFFLAPALPDLTLQNSHTFALPNIRLTMTSSIPAFILRVQYPILSENPPGDSTNIDLLEPCNKSRWQVTLTRVYDLLKIDVKGLELNGMSIINEYMHIIPMSGSKPIIAYVNPQILRSYRAVSGKTLRDSTGSRQT